MQRASNHSVPDEPLPVDLEHPIKDALVVIGESIGEMLVTVFTAVQESLGNGRLELDSSQVDFERQLIGKRETVIFSICQCGYTQPGMPTA